MSNNHEAGASKVEARAIHINDDKWVGDALYGAMGGGLMLAMPAELVADKIASHFTAASPQSLKQGDRTPHIGNGVEGGVFGGTIFVASLAAVALGRKLRKS
jgi:hypothetical protein